MSQKLMGKIFLDPETNNKFAPKNDDGWKTSRLPFGARFIFQVLLLLVSGRN